MSDNIRDVIIIGSGPAGLTAAIYSARANLSPLLFQGQQPGGQLTTTTDVENFPGFPDGIMGPALMQQMEAQAKRFGAEIIFKTITKVDFGSRPFKVFFEEEENQTNAVIISTGATARTLGLERESELMGYGLSTCATCDGAFFREQDIVVIGGGDSACEEALFLTKFGKKVTLVHRRDQLRASKIMAERVAAHEKVEIVWDHTLVELLGDQKGGLTGGIYKNTTTGDTQTINSNAIFYAIGHTPNTGLFEGTLETDNDGYLITKPDSAKTSIEGIFACGDVQDHVYRQAITAAGSGCMAAIEAERFLAEN